MNRRKGMQMVVVLVLGLAVTLMSVAYAVQAYVANLEINGVAKVNKAVWNVKFDSETYAESTGSVEATTTTIEATSVAYEVTLEKPGDFYEFTIDIVNAGTLNAFLKSVKVSALDEAQAKYVQYTVTHNGTVYTADQSDLEVDLAAGEGVHPVKVRVEYVQPDNAADLPTEEQTTLNLSATFNYEQKM